MSSSPPPRTEPQDDAPGEDVRLYAKLMADLAQEEWDARMQAEQQAKVLALALQALIQAVNPVLSRAQDVLRESVGHTETGVLIYRRNEASRALKRFNTQEPTP